MRTFVVMQMLVVSEDHPRLAQSVDHLSIHTISTKLVVEALNVAILPGTSWINVEGLDPVSKSHFWMALAMNSGPLSLRIYLGAPCSVIISLRERRTSVALMARSEWIQWHSLVNSSIKLKTRSLPPRSVKSLTKSHAQACLRYSACCGSPVESPFRRLRGLGGGTCNPLFTAHPLHQLLAHGPAFVHKLAGDLSVTETRVTLRHLHDLFFQKLLLFGNFLCPVTQGPTMQFKPATYRSARTR